MLSVRKVAVLGLVAALAVVIGTLRPGVPTERSEAYFLTPGGLAALPTFMPAFPLDPAAGLGSGIDQIMPAFAPASGPGSFAIVTAICIDRECPGAGGVGEQRTPSPTVTFTMSKVFPFNAVAATFTANGAQELVCTDDGSCDLSDPCLEDATVGAGCIGSGYQHVAVGLTGGGENETISVTACYEPDVGVYPGPVPGERDCRSVMVTFVETIFVTPPIEAASGAGPAMVSYRCDDVGLYTAPAHVAGPGELPIVPAPLVQATPAVSWEEVFDWFFANRLAGLNPTGALRPSADRPFYSCGADTAVTADDRVTLETDEGILSADWAGDIGSLALLGFVRPFGSLSPACDAGDSVDIVDHPGPVLDTRRTVDPSGNVVAVPSDWCDLDFAPNGVVTYPLVGTGQAGVATVIGQQSGGVGPLRTVYPSFTGLAAFSLVMDAPEVIGLEGGEFTVVVVDAGFRFLEGVTVECSAEPREAVLAIVPQTGTSGALPEPFVNFTLFPTRSAVETGVDVTITCFVDENPDVFATAPVRIGKPVEDVDLVAGCNPIASTWPDGTPIETVAEAVSPGEALDAIWALDPEAGEWQGYSPDAPEASDLESVDELDAIFACMSEAGTISRPEI